MLLLSQFNFIYRYVVWFSPQGAHGSLEDPKSVTHHKLIHAASERVLSDTKTILEENIQDQGKEAMRGSIHRAWSLCPSATHMVLFWI